VATKNLGYDHLLYKRGYVLSGTQIPPPIGTWKTEHVGSYYLCFDPDSPFAYAEASNEWVAIVGKVIDTLHWSADVQAVTAKCLKSLEYSEDRMLDYVDYLNGRFIVLYHHGGKTRLMTDAFGLRSTFYTFREPLTVSSHAKIINDRLKLGESRRMAIIKRYPDWIDRTGFGYPGNLTAYEEVYLLTPNTLIEIEERRIRRFYPRKALPIGVLGEVAEEIGGIMKKQIELLHKNYNLAMSLTAGLDSRTALATARDIAKEIVFFTYGHIVDISAIEQASTQLVKYISGMYRTWQMKRDCDISVASEIAEALELKHICLVDDGGVSVEDFRAFNEVLGCNNYHVHLRRLAKAYMDKLPPGVLHVASVVSQVGRVRGRWWLDESALTAERMAQLYSLGGYEIIEAFRQYSEVVELDRILNYSAYDMFYWEHHLGSWVPYLALEGDMAMDTFQPFNCRVLVERVLSLPTIYNMESTVYFEIIRRHWPILLSWPVNEPTWIHRVETLQVERIKDRARIEKLQEKAKALEMVKAVRDSFSFQLGHMLVEAIVNPGWNTVLLPYRLARLCLRRRLR
jgi:hypothetical protein